LRPAAAPKAADPQNQPYAKKIAHWGIWDEPSLARRCGRSLVNPN